MTPLHPRVTLAALGTALGSSATTLLTAAGPLHSIFGAHADAMIAGAAIISAGSGIVAALGRSIVPPPHESADVRNFAQSHIAPDPPEFSNLRNLESPSSRAPAQVPESLPNPAGTTGQKAKIIMDSPFASLLKQVGGALLDIGIAELEANKAEVVASAQAAGASAVSLVSNEIETAISTSKTGVLGKVAGPIVKSIADKAAQQVIAGLGGEAEALYALADNELRKLAASLAAAPAPPTAVTSAHVAATATPASAALAAQSGAGSTDAAVTEKAAA